MKRLLLALVVALAACGENANGSRPTPPRDPSLFLAEDSPPCRTIQLPWRFYFNVRTSCGEIVYDNVTPPEAVPALMGLAFGDDGALYMTRTARGEIWVMPDADGDQFPDDPVLFADGLRWPTALALHDGALYVLWVGGIARLEDTDGDLRADAETILIDDLPADSGIWPKSIGIGPDGRLYVGTGAAEGSDDPRRGAILSYALDGSDERIVATGFRDPAGLAWHPQTGALWVADGGPPGELNRVAPGADYGYPACDPARMDEAVCVRSQEPALTLPDQSHPAGIVFYDSETFPAYAGNLIVALSGSWNLPEPVGYSVTRIEFLGGTPSGRVEHVVPYFPYVSVQPPSSYYGLLRLSLFPYHPAAVAVSAEGWLYFSLEEGVIVRLRPRSRQDIQQ